MQLKNQTPAYPRKTPPAAPEAGAGTRTARAACPPPKRPPKVDWQSPTLRAMKRALRAEARNAAHGGTPETSIKLRLGGGPPVERLLKAGRIGPLELAAAEEIERAVTAIVAGVALRPMRLERLDCGSGRHEPVSLIDAVARYMRWARLWARRASSGDQTFRMVRAAVIEAQSSGWLDRDTAKAWEEEAANGWSNR